MEIKDNIKTMYDGYGKLVHNAMLMNTHKDKDFLQFLCDKKVLHFYNYQNPSQEAMNEFFKLLDLFEAKYKDSYDLGFEWNGMDLNPYFKVLYPKFTITNSEGESHEIQDLFVIHKVSYNSVEGGHIYTKHPEGGRFSKNLLEIAGGYQQSHLPGYFSWPDNPFYADKFCLGGDTDVSRMVAEFKVEMDWDRYELYLFCIDSMVTWESLEGVPHRKMRDIKNALSNKVTGVDNRKVNRVVNTIIKDRIPLEVDFYIEKGIFRIRPNEKANAFIKKIIFSIYTFSDYQHILVSRVPNTFDEYLKMTETKTSENPGYLPSKIDYTIFRGQKIFAKKIKEDRRNTPKLTVDDYIVYPNFLKDVLSELESRIYGKAVTKSGIKIHNSLNNANRSVTSDTVSM